MCRSAGDCLQSPLYLLQLGNVEVLKGGVPVNSKKKGMTLVAKQRAAGWLFLCTCIYHDRSYELLSDDSCIHHFFTDGRWRKYEICRANFQ